ncbi:MAG: hypothetical protein JXA71_09310 [Chitinispirillaceae bacterium]|nr:hypothetical protein [Chitinispirillaceae bacterium]
MKSMKQRSRIHPRAVWRVAAAALLSMLLLLCLRHDSSLTPPDTPVRPDTSAIKTVPRTPVAPPTNDTSFTITGLRSWYLIGDSLTKGNDTVDAVIRAPASAGRIDLFLDRSWACTLGRPDTTFILRLPLSSLPAGRHSLLFSADTAETAFAEMTLHRSAPYYVTVSNDWECSQSEGFDSNLTFAVNLHQSHPGLVMTYFVGPYFFTDPAVPEQRRQWIADFVKTMRSDYGDEIGLHLHPWCHFVNAAGIDCITDNDFPDLPPDTTGYGISCYRYSEAEFLKLLQTADSIFLSRGLGKPTSFRAGGWSCALHTLQALRSAGYKIDASGCNVSLMDELWGLRSVDWLAANWHTITDTSQPYYPSQSDIALSAPPTIPVLEIPDNGLLADYVSAGEMIAVFNRNWNGVPLPHPRMCSIGYHVDNIPAYFDRLERALTHIDYYLASNDGGPVVYATMSDCAKVWTNPEAGIIRR